MKLMSSVSKINRKVGTVIVVGMAIVTTILTITSALPLKDIVWFLGFTYLVLGMVYGGIRFMKYIFEE